MDKKSNLIEMSEFKKGGRKVKKGGTYLTKAGLLREKWKDKIAIFKNNLYDIKDTKKFKFTGKKLEKGDVIDTWEGLSLNNGNLLEDLATQNNITGDNYIVIKRNNKIIFDGDYNIDELSSNREDFNSGESPYKIWNSDLEKRTKIEIIFSKNKKIPKAYFKQKFLDGVLRHCFFQDILDYYEKKIEYCEENGISSKKYKGLVNKINGKKGHIGDIEKFKYGISEEDILEKCKDYNIAIKIFLPFQEDPIIEFKPPNNNFYGKTFTYTNTRLNHLEYIKKPITHTDIFYRTHNPEEKTFQELQELVKNLHDKKELALTTRGTFGYSSVKTKDKFYTVKEDLQKYLIQFEEETNLKWCSFDAVEYPLLNTFVKAGTHFNGTVDFQDCSYLDNIIDNSIYKPSFIKHIDQTNAYTQFKKSKYYCGFMGKITDFRKFEGDPKQPGLYYVNSFDWSNLENSPKGSKLLELNLKLKWFEAGNIYSKPELDLLKSFNVNYDIKYACFGKRIDFDFPDYMFKKHEIEKYNIKFNIPYYAIWSGMKASDGSKTSYYMMGNHSYFGLYQKDIYFNEERKETKITFDNPTNKTKRHLTAQITAYQRLIMMEQLLEMDLSKIYRVCVDGIYYSDHKFNMNETFREKEKLTFRNSETERYLSNIFDESKIYMLDEELKDLPPFRVYYDKELWLGAGGTGKSFQNLKDLGFIHPVYIAPSWKLSASQKGKFKNLVHHSINNDDKLNNWSKKFNVYFGDEASMMTQYNMNKWSNNILGRIIMMGDLEAQLEPVIEKNDLILAKTNNEPERLIQMNTKGFDNIIKLNYVYRFQCEKLRGICENIRDIIINNKKHSAKKILKSFNVINIDQVKDHYDYKKDIILVVRHKGKYSNEDYNNRFIEDKFKITDNKCGYYNGDIVFEKIKGVKHEKRHGFTIHSVQGETFENKIFIDLNHIILNDKISNLKMFYTAISRARKLNQIYIVLNVI